MARVYPNPLVDAFSGKMGNMVFYRRGSGVFCRKWVKPRDPRSHTKGWKPHAMRKERLFFCMVFFYKDRSVFFS
ncbi:MAG: hypothetical protein GY754_03160 [bacterium]|nr:hypothetical protein [bacterium]